MSALRQILKNLSQTRFVSCLESEIKNGSRIRLDQNGNLLTKNLEKCLLNEATLESNRVRSVLIDSNLESWPRFGELNKNVRFNVAFKPNFVQNSNGFFHLLEDEEGKSKFQAENETPLRMLTVFKKEDWKFLYQDLLRSRRKLWKKFMVNPWSIKVEEKNAASENPSATIRSDFEDQDLNLSEALSLETLSVIEDQKMSAKVAKMFAESESNLKIIETKSNLNSGSLAVLLDSHRKRVFADSSRLALPTELTPHQVALFMNSSNLNCSYLRIIEIDLTEWYVYAHFAVESIFHPGFECLCIVFLRYINLYVVHVIYYGANCM